MANLDALELVPENTRALFSATEANGQGFGGDAERGAAAAADGHRKLPEPTDNTPIVTSDAFIVCTGLDGRTDGPTAAVLVERFSEVYDQPVYGVGTFSATTINQQHASSTLWSLRQLVSKTDHVFGFDMVAWAKNEDGPVSDEVYDTLNVEFARRPGTLFTAGEITTADNVGTSVVDASEIMNTLRGGGLAALGCFERPPPPRNTSVVGRLKRLVGDDAESVD